MASTPEPPYPNRTEVFVVLHYVETELCPEPLSEHAGLNVQKTVCVYNTQLYADRHAMRYAEDRRLTLHLPPDAIEPGEKYDYSGAYIG